MAERAKIFQNGGSQAVRLPKSCRFEDGQEEVIARRVGKKGHFWSLPTDGLEDFLACLGAWKEDIPRPAQKSIAKKRNPLDQP